MMLTNTTADLRSGVIFACVVGFFPPSNLPVGNPTFYVSLVAGGLIVFLSVPLIIHRFRKASWKPQTVSENSDEKK